MLMAIMHHTGRECLRRALFGPANHNDHKRSKYEETDPPTYSEKTLIRDGTIYY